MTWRKPANRAFVQAVISAFHEEPRSAFEQLSRCSAQAWDQSDYWLDASGLALYFHDLLCRHSMSHLEPARTRERLRSNLRKNARRTEALFREFMALNDAFQREGITYSNYKGFTLYPHACPAPSLRHQLDLDFLVEVKHLPAARYCLENRGYRLSAASERTWEFKTGDDARRKRWDNYTMGTYRSVELHFGIHPTGQEPAGADERLNRLCAWTWQGNSYPSLSASDQLLGQALHLLSHFRNESTRPAWLLEFRHHAHARRSDPTFWDDVMGLASKYQYGPIAFGLSILITSKMFGRFAPVPIESWALGNLPAAIQLWAERYGVEAVLADFPGTKLYLLLETQLEKIDGRPALAMRARLFPIRRLQPHFGPNRAETKLDSFRRHALIAKFAVFRLRFHLAEATRICMELPRWRRLLRERCVINESEKCAREMTNRKQLHDNLRASSR